MRAVEREIELQTDWVEAACDHAGSHSDEVIAEAENAFDTFLATENRRECLANGESEFAVARAVKKEITYAALDERARAVTAGLLAGAEDRSEPALLLYAPGLDYPPGCSAASTRGPPRSPPSRRTPSG